MLPAGCMPDMVYSHAALSCFPSPRPARRRATLLSSHFVAALLCCPVVSSLRCRVVPLPCRTVATSFCRLVSPSHPCPVAVVALPRRRRRPVVPLLCRLVAPPSRCPVAALSCFPSPHCPVVPLSRRRVFPVAASPRRRAAPSRCCIVLLLRCPIVPLSRCQPSLSRSGVKSAYGVQTIQL